MVPRARPRRGNVVYDEAVRDMAQVRVDLRWRSCATTASRRPARSAIPTRSLAAIDAVAAEASTRSSSPPCRPTTSGWLKRDLPERLREATGLPVEHVVSDVIGEGLPFDVTLVAANLTAAGERAAQPAQAAGR